MRRPDNNKSRSSDTCALAGRSYVQRLSVQVPNKNVTDLVHREGEDVLRLIIHVEESQSNNGSRADMQAATTVPATRNGEANLRDEQSAETAEAARRSIERRKVSWHNNAAEMAARHGGCRPLLKHIGRQRSASLETSTTELEEVAGQVLRRSASLRLRISPIRTATKATPTATVSATASSNSPSSSPSGNVVKELRRSSELLRNILFSLSSRRSSESSASQKETCSPSLSGCPATETADLQAALQAHRKRRWQSGCVAGGATTCGLMSTHHLSISESDLSNAGLFQAVATNNVGRTRMLLDSGVDPNVPNDSGFTVLHWCTVQTPLPWPCIIELLEHGAKVEQRDQDGTQPVFLLPNLPKVQQQLVKDAIQYMRGSLPDLRSEEANQPSNQVGRDGRDRDPHRAAANLFRRLQQGATRRQPLAKHKSKDLPDSVDVDYASKSFEAPHSSIDGSDINSRTAAGAESTTRAGDEAANRLLRSLSVLSKMAVNPECLPIIFQSLTENINVLAKILQESSNPGCHSAMATFLHNLLKSSVTATTHREADYPTRNADQQQEQLLSWLSILLSVAVEFLSGSHSVQFTALVLINKIIDVATATGLVASPYRNRDRDRDRDRQQRSRRQAPTRSHGTWRGADKSGNHVPSSSWKQVILQREVSLRDVKSGDVDENEDPQQQPQQQQQQQQPSTDSSRCGLGQLISQKIHAGTVLSLILNAITLQRRVVGTRTRCTPSLRTRQCSYHCLQILSGRVLLFLAQSTHSRDQLIQEAQLRMVIEALDYTLDPQLLCLVLQTVALLALDYRHQPALLQSGIPDALTQLVLPSDEWYYTNHTTRFSRIVKYHAARVLVYLGLAKCLGPRVSLFEHQPADSVDSVPALSETAEDIYVMHTLSNPSTVYWTQDGRRRLTAISPEELALRVMNISGQDKSNGIPLYSVPVLIDPIILIRLLHHWILSRKINAPIRKRSSRRRSAVQCQQTSSATACHGGGSHQFLHPNMNTGRVGYLEPSTGLCPDTRKHPHQERKRSCPESSLTSLCQEVSRGLEKKPSGAPKSQASTSAGAGNPTEAILASMQLLPLPCTSAVWSSYNIEKNVSIIRSFTSGNSFANQPSYGLLRRKSQSHLCLNDIGRDSDRTGSDLLRHHRGLNSRYDFDDLRSLQRQLQNFPNLSDLKSNPLQWLSVRTPSLESDIIVGPSDISNVECWLNSSDMTQEVDRETRVRRMRRRVSSVESNAFVVLQILQELIESQVINPQTESTCREIEDVLESVSTVNFTCLRACDELRDKHLQKTSDDDKSGDNSSEAQLDNEYQQVSRFQPASRIISSVRRTVRFIEAELSTTRPVSRT